MNSTKIHPVQGRNYTLREIIHQLELRDVPCLQFWHKDRLATIQTSHFTDAQLEAKCPLLMSSFWTYKYETAEWVPVFDFHDTLTFAMNDLMRQLTVERDIDPYADDPRKLEWWVVPRALPREQFYNDPVEKARLKESSAHIDLDDPDWREKLWRLRQERSAAVLERRQHKHLPKGY